PRPSGQDDDGDDVHVHHAHVVPQQPQSTRQTAVKEADDTVNPDVKNVRPTMPAGTSNEPVDNEVERQGEKDERDENDGDGDENVLHTHVVPHPTPPASEPPPPSTPLEGEQATHDDEPPQAKPRGQDDDGTDNDVQDARVEPQEPQTTGQTAVNDEATDTSNPHANGAGTTMPDEKGEWASGIKDPSSNDDGGDEDVRHAYVVPDTTQPVPYHVPPPPNERSPPPSTPLEGENGQKSSGHRDKTATYLEDPRDESPTTSPRRTPSDDTSNGEGRGEAVGGDDEVEGSDDAASTSYRVDEERSRREVASDEASRDEWRRRKDEAKVEAMEVERSRQVEGTSKEGEESTTEEARVGEESRTVRARSMTVMDVDDDGHYISNDEDSPRTPPEPPPPAPAPHYPEHDDDDDAMKLNKTAA
ncbi:hypothetical protein PAXINDRAFT_16193, partial [Paxillus involutus ATCC 200175]